jgi:hypothetical protein
VYVNWARRLRIILPPSESLSSITSEHVGETSHLAVGSEGRAGETALDTALAMEAWLFPVVEASHAYLNIESPSKVTYDEPMTPVTLDEQMTVAAPNSSCVVLVCVMTKGELVTKSNLLSGR